MGEGGEARRDGVGEKVGAYWSGVCLLRCKCKGIGVEEELKEESKEFIYRPRNKEERKNGHEYFV